MGIIANFRASGAYGPRTCARALARFRARARASPCASPRAHAPLARGLDLERAGACASASALLGASISASVAASNLVFL